jgi:hypothetical protein
MLVEEQMNKLGLLKTNDSDTLEKAESVWPVSLQAGFSELPRRTCRQEEKPL